MPRLMSMPVALGIVVVVMAAGAIWVVRLVRAGAADEKKYTSAEVETTKASARVILDAIERSVREKGKPVWRLESLVPEYLAALPEPAVRYKQWAYEYDEARREYSLGFSTSARRAVSWYWSSGTRAWSGPAR